MSIDLSKIVLGDEVTVRGIVSATGTYEFGGPCVSVTLANGTNHSVPQASIVSWSPKLLAVGDLVKHRAGVGPQETLAVRAITNGWAWLGDTGKRGFLAEVDDLERVQ